MNNEINTSGSLTSELKVINKMTTEQAAELSEPHITQPNDVVKKENHCNKNGNNCARKSQKMLLGVQRKIAKQKPTWLE